MKFAYRHIVPMFLAVGFLAGCSSTVTRDTSGQPSPISASTTERFGSQPVSVNIALNENAQSALKDNDTFDSKQLQGAFESQLNARNLLAPPNGGNAMKLNVEITDVRVRGTATALLLGVFAGNDYIKGNVTLLDANNQPIDQFKVSAEYAFGGLVGGQTGLRMDWLYKTFAEKTFLALQQNK